MIYLIGVYISSKKYQSYLSYL